MQNLHEVREKIAVACHQMIECIDSKKCSDTSMSTGVTINVSDTDGYIGESLSFIDAEGVKVAVENIIYDFDRKTCHLSCAYFDEPGVWYRTIPEDFLSERDFIGLVKLLERVFDLITMDPRGNEFLETKVERY